VRSFERQGERQGKGATTWRLDLAFVMVRARQRGDT